MFEKEFFSFSNDLKKWTIIFWDAIKITVWITQRTLSTTKSDTGTGTELFEGRQVSDFGNGLMSRRIKNYIYVLQGIFFTVVKNSAHLMPVVWVLKVLNAENKRNGGVLCSAISILQCCMEILKSCYIEFCGKIYLSDSKKKKRKR